VTAVRALLQVEDAAKRYRAGRSKVRAVDGVTLEVVRGETLGLVGESGCGKSTLGRLMCCLEAPTKGRVLFEGVDAAEIPPQQLRALRPRMQMIFQDPFASLNPHKTVSQIVGLPLRIQQRASKKEIREHVAQLLEMVGLDPSQGGRFPHQFSGGQRQRIGIARALACEPDLIVADEPVASLDVSIQAQILQIMRELQRRFSMTAVFISHDVSVVSHVSQRVAVMYLGKIVELGPAQSVIRGPLHPYARALISAVPRLDRSLQAQVIRLSGDPPSPMAVPPGCRFHTRCFLDLIPECRTREPELREIRAGHLAACHIAQ
jgi:oligopeptide/dipeptide ABC transporter ATP-binding protein